MQFYNESEDTHLSGREKLDEKYKKILKVLYC